jgi:hypothetical protein
MMAPWFSSVIMGRVLIVACLASLLSSCQTEGSHKLSPIYPNSEIILQEPYAFTVGLARYRHYFPAGIYRAAYEDETGIYFRHEKTRYGIFIPRDQQQAYLWTTADVDNDPVDRKAIRNVLGPGGALVAEVMLPRPKPGSIVKLFKVTGDWRSVFQIRSRED